jgi:hypothetical protein
MRGRIRGVNFAHILDKTIYPLQPLIVLAAVIAWVFAAAGHMSARRNGRRTSPMFFAGILGFAAIIGAEFGVAAIVKQAALKEIRPKLFANVAGVEVNGTPAKNRAALVDAVRNMHDIMAHHSSPRIRFEVLLETANGPLALCLGRDSQDNHEYWVYYSGFHSTQSNEIGHVFTSALDGM